MSGSAKVESSLARARYSEAAVQVAGHCRAIQSAACAWLQLLQAQKSYSGSAALFQQNLWRHRFPDEQRPPGGSMEWKFHSAWHEDVHNPSRVQVPLPEHAAHGCPLLRAGVPDRADNRYGG